MFSGVSLSAADLFSDVGLGFHKELQMRSWEGEP